jgi:hypothetical protein
MMLYLVEYDKGYHTDQLEPMGTIFARAVAFAQSLKFDRILQDVLQKSKPPTSTIIDSRIPRGWRSNSEEASATNDQ